MPDAQGAEHESLATLAVKVPQAVFCLLTALQIHELTTQLPRQVWIAMPQGSHVPKMDYPPVKMVQFSGEAYTQGIEVANKTTANDLWRFAKVCRVANVMQPYLEALGHGG